MIITDFLKTHVLLKLICFTKYLSGDVFNLSDPAYYQEFVKNLHESPRIPIPFKQNLNEIIKKF